MRDPGRGESSIARRQEFHLLADAHHAAALQQDVEFVLALMCVKRVLLTKIEGIQSREKRITLHQSGLGHFVRREPGEAADAFHEHDVQFTAIPKAADITAYPSPLWRFATSCRNSVGEGWSWRGRPIRIDTSGRQSFCQLLKGPPPRQLSG